MMNKIGNFTYISKCPVCNNIKFKKVFLKKWIASSYVKCIKCKLIFQNPQENINNTLKRYGIDYFKYELENQYNFFNLIKKTIYDFDLLKKLPEKSRVLEIGSATGLFIKYMNDKGHDAVGLEICTESVNYGKKNYKVNLINKKLEDTSFNNNEFDFIHFSHLIEHLNDPYNFLIHINRILKKDGFIIVTTPNSSGLFSKVYNESWRCIVDDHLFIFNKKNLIKLLNNTNFNIIKIKTWGSIPAGGKNRSIKKFFDWYVKKTGSGDVVSILAVKK